MDELRAPGALLLIALAIGLVAVALPPETRDAIAGSALILGVIALLLGAKALLTKSE